ncbi:HlyD family efflux transporter periplasmic adaptor subunit [bacterium]|nr:HlyD family efflux transporter periplasmic adaptor subunit [bacterium]
MPAAPTSRPASQWPWFIALIFAGVAVYASLGGTIPFIPRPLATQTAAVSSETDEATTDGPEVSVLGAGGTETATGSQTPPPTPAGTIVLESKGYIIPEQQILVSPQVSGRVIELNFDAGQQVEQGFVLAVIDSTEYQADFERAQAQTAAARQREREAREGNRPDEIRQAEAELAEAQTQLEQAERTYERKRDLFEKKIVTPQDLEDSQSEYQALTRRVEKLKAMAQLMIDGPREERKQIAKAELQAAEAELVRAQWRLDNTIIKAPIQGTILKKNAELGNLVNPVAFNGSYSLCDIADLSKLEVELDIQERDIAKVKAFQKCRIRAEAFPQRTYEGYVSRLMPIANRAKGAVPVRVRIAVPPEEQGQYLKPEMGALVTFFSETVDPATFGPAAVSPASTTEAVQ